MPSAALVIQPLPDFLSFAHVLANREIMVVTVLGQGSFALAKDFSFMNYHIASRWLLHLASQLLGRLRHKDFETRTLKPAWVTTTDPISKTKPNQQTRPLKRNNKKGTSC